MTNTDHELHARLERLERENRRMKKLGMGMITGVGALALLSFVAPTLCNTVRAERIVVHDERGAERLVINAYSTKKPSVTFKDAKGASSARMQVDQKGAIELQVFKEGKPTEASFQLKAAGSGVD